MTTEQKRKEVEEALMAIPAGEHFGVKRISEHVHACFFTVRDILQEHPLVRKVEGFKRWVRLPVEGETVHPAIPQRANPKIGPVARKILDWMAELPDGSSLTVGRVVEKFDTTEHTATRTIRMAKGWTLANPVRAVTESRAT
jgi:O6-methylguanine-DNA--protein-cysteine methyltransferase